ncbi:fibrobacter succinogenes major paralogous domain-containing protein [Candidatus Saccharibacteria bacterium]|nr:fibrobacter succinogenes major paralogous domain-containing protein [Candidatus Saccharibacteria bacterium]
MKTKSLFILSGVSLSLAMISALAFSSAVSYAEGSDAIDELQVTVNVSCTLSSTLGTTPGVTASTDGEGNNTYTTSLNPETVKEINGSILSTVCNDSGGYSLYAIGYSGDSYEAPDNTKMLGTNSNINTSTTTTGDTASWSMKLAEVSGYTPPTILNSFDDYHVVPETYTQIAKYTSATAAATSPGATIQAKYQLYTGFQESGTYTSKVKYTIVHPNTAPAPSTKTYMQDATLADCGKTMYDKRDSGTETAYTTALIGGQCWMTTNLNLAGGTALSADDTDVTSAYISSFTTSNNLTKSGDTIVLPASTTSSGFDTDNYSYVANSGNASSNCSTAPGCYSYYSWDAATLGSGRTIATDNTDAEQSICPKGWHLPNTRTGTNNTSDFRKLMIALGGSSSKENYDSSTTPTGATMSTTLQASPNNFLRAGYYIVGSFDLGGRSGYYWSSTSYSNNSRARLLFFNSSYVYSANYFSRGQGYSVRCVLGS